MKWFKPYEVLMAVLLVFLAGCGGEAKTSAREESPMPTLEVFATGANISGANGIHFGPDGLLYVASVIGSDLTVLDPASGEVVKVHRRGRCDRTRRCRICTRRLLLLDLNFNGRGGRF